MTLNSLSFDTQTLKGSVQDAILGISDREDFDKLDSSSKQVYCLLCFLFTRSRCIKTRLRQMFYLCNLRRYAFSLH